MVRTVVTEREIPERLPMIGSPGFVGRERELAALSRALGGGPAVVLIEGEAGIGKTRLVTEFLASPAGSGSRALVACCPPFRRSQTLGPVVDAARRAAGDGVRAHRLSGLAGALRPLFPEWAGDLPDAPARLEDASAARHRVFRALSELLGSLRVNVLVAEDVHWADEATLEFLLFLASRQPREVSLLVTCRPEDVPAGSLLPRLARLAAGAGGERIALGPLDASATAGMVSSMLAGEHVSEEFTAFLHARTDGLPLAVEESVRLMSDRADLARRDGTWVRRDLAGIDVPLTVRDAVLERAGRLGQDARAVLRAAAVLAAPAGEPVLAAVAGLSAGRARAGLCEALGSGLLAEDVPNGHGLVSFRHVLAAQAVCESVPAPRRRELHLRAGRALEGVCPRPLARLARHFREAGETAAWCRWGEQAADLALATGDEASAGALLRDLVTQGGLAARDVARLADKIPVLLACPERNQSLVRALRAVLDAGNLEPDVEAEIRCRLGWVLLAMEDYHAGRAELEQSVPRLAHDPAAAAQAMVQLGLPFGSDWPASEHLRWLRRAAAVPAPMAPAEQLRMLANRAGALLALGEEEGWAEAARIPDDAPAGPERFQVARGQLNVGEAAMTWGRYGEARRWLARGLELARAGQYLPLCDAAVVDQVYLDWLTGAWDGLAGRAGALGADENIRPPDRLRAVLVAALLDAAAGAHARAGEQLRLVLDEARQRGAVEYCMAPAAALARLALAGDSAEDALKVTDELAGIVAGKGVWMWAADIVPARSCALAAAGRAGEAADLVAAFARGLRGRDAPAPRAALATCRAVLAGARGEHDRAAGLSARAAAAWQALPRPYEALLASERQACCLLAAGRVEAALTVLPQVFHGLSDLGARGDADRVAGLLRRHGADVRREWRRGRRGYGDQLSPRELEVVRLVVTGRTNREIASALSRSPKTVAGQLESAMRKLGVSSRTALAVCAVEAGAAPGHPLAGLR